MTCVHVRLSTLCTFDVFLRRTVVVDETTLVEVTFTGKPSAKLVVVVSLVMVCSRIISIIGLRRELVTRGIGYRVSQDSRSSV